MAEITSVRLWADPGYSRGAVIVPKASAVLPSPDATYTGVFTPNKSDLFSRLALPVPYCDVMNMAYIEIIVDWNNSTASRIFYGWIDSVDIKSDTDAYPQTVLTWHVDLWRTYIGTAEFGYGMVQRRPTYSGDSIPPQPYPHRFITASVVQNLTPSSIWWVYINATANEMASTTVVNTTYVFPVNTLTNSYAETIRGQMPSGGTWLEGKTLSLGDVVTGAWDEVLGVDPANLLSAFISPVPPAPVSGRGIPDDPYILSSWDLAVKTVDSTDTYVFERTGNVLSFDNNYEEQTIAITPVTTTDTDTYVITGFDGEPIGELPWGITVDSLSYRTIMAGTSAYLQFRTSVTGHLTGTCYTVPLIPIDITENSWSSYVYSGARQAEIDQRILNADVTKHQATQAAYESAITSAGMGALMGGLTMGPTGAVTGAGAGIANTVVQGVTANLDYQYQTGEVTDRAQRISDYKAVLQANGLLMAGTGFDAIQNGCNGVSLALMTADSYSTGVRDTDIAYFGAHVSEPTADCTSLITAGGGLQISNLIVGGNIPTNAKMFIKQRLENGVRIL